MVSTASTTQTTARSLEDCLAQIHKFTAFRSAFMAAQNSGSQPPLDVSLLQPLLDAVGLFTKLHIPYALIGGVAAMTYGRARPTDDVDFVASADHESRLAANPEIMRAFHFDASSTWKLYHDSGISIDIWKDQYSSKIAERSVPIKLGEHELKVAEVHDLIAMKLRANRPQDDYDISEIIRAGKVNEQTLAGLVTQEEFARFGEIKARISKMR
jgi:hypothetical protein